jgi:hypothetical protein
VLNPLSHRKVLKKGDAGVATIVEMGALDRGGTSFNLPMTLQVYVEGLTPYEVEDQWMVKAMDTVALSGQITVNVDRENHEKVAIDWDGVRANYEQEKSAREQALASQGPVGDPSQMGGQFGGADQFDEFGGDIGAAAPPAPAPSGGGDDTVAKLERLAALKDRGAITGKEFERENHKLLGG